MKRKLLGILVAAAMAAGSLAGATVYAASEPAHAHGHADAAQKLVLHALASRRASPQELAEIRKLLDSLEGQDR